MGHIKELGIWGLQHQCRCSSGLGLSLLSLLHPEQIYCDDHTKVKAIWLDLAMVGWHQFQQQPSVVSSCDSRHWHHPNSRLSLIFRVLRYCRVRILFSSETGSIALASVSNPTHVPCGILHIEPLGVVNTLVVRPSPLTWIRDSLSVGHQNCLVPQVRIGMNLWHHNHLIHQ